jgi:hypothetical protein
MDGRLTAFGHRTSMGTNLGIAKSFSIHHLPSSFFASSLAAGLLSKAPYNIAASSYLAAGEKNDR